MSIQSTINQGISIASLLVTQNPAVQAKAEERHKLRQLEKQKSTLEKARDITAQKAQATAAEKYQSDISDINREIFELKPNQESLKAYQESKMPEAITISADPWEIAEEMRAEELREQEVSSALQQMREMGTKADDALLAAQEQRRSGRRVFTQYMADEPLSIGGESFGTFGQLPKNLQKEAAKNYSKKEKTEIMNRKDELNG